MAYSSLQFAAGSHISSCGVHIHDRFPDLAAVQFMRSGSLYFQRGCLPRREWTQPVFFWSDLQTTYRYGPGGTGAWDHYWVNFRGPALTHHFLPLLEELAPTGIVPARNASEVGRIILALIHRVQNRPDDAAGCTHLLHQLLAAVHSGRPGLPEADVMIRRIREEIDASPESAWDFQDLARKHGLSHSRFRARFRGEVGSPPANYVTIRRLREAARLLADTTLPATEIGDRMGYPEPSHFSKAFKRQYGVSPRRYRASLRAFSDEPAGGFS